MSINFIIIIFFYFLITASTLGYGYLTKNLLISKNINLDYGSIGLVGFFFLTFYSYFSHFFIAHNLIHNSFLILIGIILFIINFKSNYHKNDFKIICLIFLLLLIAFFCFKTHDDFPYYHFPYINYLTKSDLIIGVGNYDPSWRSPSSIFYFNSLFYLPFVKYNLYHIGALLIMGYSLAIICIKLFEKYNSEQFDQLFFYKLLSLAFIIIFFYRLSEHGTDRSAQILGFVLILEIIYFLKKEQKFDKFFIKLFIIGSLAISLKVFYLVYLILLIPVIHFLYKEKKIICILKIFKNKFFYLSIIFLSFVTTVNFLNSGCLAYPLTASCFENFSWSTPLNEVERMKYHYENWSKSGAGPNFMVNDLHENIANLNWLPGWIDRYFFTKVSDFLLGLIVMSLIFFFTFFSNNRKRIKKKLNLNVLYIILIILFIEWFYNHPALRYGGYYIIALLIFIPLSKILSSFGYTKSFKIRMICILFLAISIFFYRNIDRIYNEYVKYDFSPIKNVYYDVNKDHHFRVEREFDKTIEFYMNCTKKKIVCENQNKLLAFKRYGKFIFVQSSDFEVREFKGKDILIKK